MKTLKLVSALLACVLATTIAGARAGVERRRDQGMRPCLQKQTVGAFPLFVHDGTRRGAAADAPPGMLQSLLTMETFSVWGGQIHHVEAAPFVTIPYGLSNGWTPGSGR